jgi:hypothetical protein
MFAVRHVYSIGVYYLIKKVSQREIYSEDMFLIYLMAPVSTKYVIQHPMKHDWTLNHESAEMFSASFSMTLFQVEMLYRVNSLVWV